MGEEPLSFEERIGRNEARFRDVNEGIRAGRQMDDEPVSFVCECGSPDCSNLIELTLGQYEAVRGDSRRFAVLPGHDYPETERVVERHDAYWVVEKYENGAHVTRALDPRG